MEYLTTYAQGKISHFEMI